MATSNVSPLVEIAQAVAEQLSQVGIEVTVATITPADFQIRLFESRDFDLAVTNGSWGPDPENLYTRFGSKGAYQFMGYESAEFDAAIAEGARLTKLEERARAYFHAQEVLARDLPLAPLAEYIQFQILRDNVTGLSQTEARGLVTFNDFSLVRVQR